MAYYHLIIEKKVESSKEKNNIIYAYDLDKITLVETIVKPYFCQDKFIVNGYILDSSMITRLKILSSDKPIDVLVNEQYESDPKGVLIFHTRETVLNTDSIVKDVTIQLINEVKNGINESEKVKEKVSQEKDSKYIFIVHGHELSKVAEVESFVYSIDYKPIVLFKEPNAGQTIIEKIETYTSKACYAIILYTKSDFGYDAEHPDAVKPRARQNVIFEHGYLMAQLKRDHVCALMDGDDIEKPGDISGIIYETMDSSGNWKYKIANNMRVVGINVDLHKIK